MKPPPEPWDPFRTTSWARALGLAHVPMFGARQSAPFPGEHAVLLDGRRGTFALTTTEERKLFLEEPEPLSWSWSSDTRCLLVVDRRQGDMAFRRWDAPHLVRRYQLPRNPAEAQRVLSLVEEVTPVASADVVTYLLDAFRKVRWAVAAGDALSAVKVFMLLLLGAEAVGDKRLELERWKAIRTVSDLLAATGELAGINQELQELPRTTLNNDISGIPISFVTPDYKTGCKLLPSLLLRHASGRLFQEAHLVIERDPLLPPPLPNFGNFFPERGTLGRDVRYTPAALARALSEQALDRWKSPERLGPGNPDGVVTILDPACGSGIFLQESLRELERRGYDGTVRLRGMDVTDISCVISRFCLERARHESTLLKEKVGVEISSPTNALTEEADWGAPDVVLMNPPFVNYLSLNNDDKKRVREVLRGVVEGQPDMAMAFVWKGVKSLSAGGVLATVMPSSFFENRAGLEWRRQVQAKTEPLLFGRFRGYGYFPASLVEPAFMLLKATSEHAAGSSGERPSSIRILIADEGSEDVSLRALRLDEDSAAESGGKTGYELYTLGTELLRLQSWMPRSRSYVHLLTYLREQELPVATELFDVREGINTGRRSAFMLDEQQWKALPKKEREEFFLPVAGQDTIREGRLKLGKYIFWPYSRDGEDKLLITSEEELQNRVPIYLDRILGKHREQLAAKRQIWWTLERHRSWTLFAAPKLVTTNFGANAPFAYDQRGGFAVQGGHAWLWRGGANDVADRPDPSDEEQDEDDSGQFDFHATDLPWGYLALLNSGFFALLLEGSCPRVRGGQFELAKKYLASVHLPNLADEAAATSRTLERLARIGRAIHEGKEVDWLGLDDLARRAYRIPTSLKLNE